MYIVYIDFICTDFISISTFTLKLKINSNKRKK